MFVPNGTIASEWFPDGDETSFTLKSLMIGTDPQDPYKSLQPHKQDLVIVSGLDNAAAYSGTYVCTHNHIPTTLSGRGLLGDSIETATASGITLDQVIAQEIDKVTPLKATCLPLGLPFNSLNATIGFRGPNEPVPAYVQPADAFRAVFGDATLGQEELQRRWARRQSILDDVKGDYQALVGRVGTSDTQRVEAHLQAIRELEVRLSTEVACSPQDPMYPDYGQFPSDDLPNKVRSFIDLAVLAISCDVSRVVTLIPRPCGGGSNYLPWLGLPGSEDYTYGEMHEQSHFPNDPDRRATFLRMLTWFTEQYAYFIQKLKDVPEGEATLFENTTVFQFSEISDGAAHSVQNMPYVLAGSLGGAFRTGRYLRYESIPHNNLLVSILQAFGSQETTFGDPTLCTGPLAGLA